MKKIKQSNNTRIIGIMGILFYFLAVEMQLLPFSLFNIDISNIPVISRMIYNVCYEIFIVIILILLFKDSFIKNFKDYISNIGTYLKKYIKYWFIALGLMYISNIIVIIFNSNNIAGNEQDVRNLLNAYPIYTYILTVFIAPYLEELVFRKSIRMIIKNNWLFIIISGFVFGGMHLLGNVNNWTDLLYIFPYSLPGCVFAYTLVKSDNIMVPISLHTIHNGILITLQIIVALLA